MNLFDALSQARKSQSNPFNIIGINEQINRLNQLIGTCNYSDENKPAVEKSVRQVLNVFPSFRTEVLQYYDNNGSLRRFIELKGSANLDFQQKLEINMMFPQDFPRSPPFIRILNPNPAIYTIKPFFNSLRSKNDQRSLVLNGALNESKNWNPAKTAVNLIIEVNSLIRNNYPFEKLGQNPSNQNIWGRPSPSSNQFYQQNPNPGRENNFINNNYNNDNARSNFYSPQYESMGNKQKIQMYSPNRNFQMIGQAQSFVGKQKKFLDKLKFIHQKRFQNTQFLDITKNAIQSQQNFLLSQNFSMTKLIETNNHDDLDLASLITVKDQRSQKILTLLSSIKSRADLSYFLESKFTNQQISLPEFMRFVKQNEEDRFQEHFRLNQLTGLPQKSFIR